MGTKRLSFFATPADLTAVLLPAEAKLGFHYLHDGSVLAGQVRDAWTSARDVPDFGISRTGDRVLGPKFYLVRPGDPVRAERVHEYSGRVRDVVDQLTMPASVALTPGGVHTDGVLIAGEITTISSDPWSIHTFNALARAFRKQFRRIKVYYVGPQAEERFLKGARLTFYVKAPREYDLTSD